MHEIWPSLISADLLNLQATMDQLSDHCHGWHLDIMDNHFVPNLTWGAQFINAIGQHSNKPLWVHLMIDDPLGFLDTIHISQASYIAFHIETKANIAELIKRIRAKGWRPSIAVNPETPIDRIFPFLALLDQVLIMSVHPGFSGQAFIPAVLEKIGPLKQECHNHDIDIPIAIDGGINRENIVLIAHTGITQCAIASGIFNFSHPVKELDHLYTLLSAS